MKQRVIFLGPALVVFNRWYRRGRRCRAVLSNQSKEMFCFAAQLTESLAVAGLARPIQRFYLEYLLRHILMLQSLARLPNPLPSYKLEREVYRRGSQSNWSRFLGGVSAIFIAAGVFRQSIPSVSKVQSNISMVCTVGMEISCLVD